MIRTLAAFDFVNVDKGKRLGSLEKGFIALASILPRLVCGSDSDEMVR